MINRERQIKLTKRFEGWKRLPYRDDRRLLTIGCGRLIEPGISQGLRDSEIAFMLENDLNQSEHELIPQVSTWHDLSEVRKSVLIDICFNCGLGNFLKFKRLLKALNDRDFKQASEEIIDSELAMERKTILAAMMRSDSWPSWIGGSYAE